MLNSLHRSAIASECLDLGLGDKGLGLVAFLIIGAFFTARAGLDLALMAFSFLDFRGLGAVFFRDLWAVFFRDLGVSFLSAAMVWSKLGWGWRDTVISQ